jgi:hypothetical protein
MNPNQGMHPYGQNRRDMEERISRIQHPMAQEYGVVIVAGEEKLRRDPGRNDVPDHQWDDGQSEHDLHPFPAREPQGAAHVDRPQLIAEVHNEGAREHNGTGFGPPERHQRSEHAAR